MCGWKRWTLLASLVALMAPLTGCGGVECGEGTIEEDGRCVADEEPLHEEVCGDGTRLVEGACILDESGCGQDTVFDPDLGACVKAPGLCEESTTWDAGTEACVPNTDIVCGDMTVANANGLCVPDLDQLCGPETIEHDGSCVPDGEIVTEETCAGGTVLSNGECVLDTSGCGPNTSLDPDSGICVQQPGFCAEGTTWDAGASQCVANTDIVCGDKTVADSGKCVPDLSQVCGPKTVADANGRCVIHANACAQGELLDPNTGDCIPSDTFCSPTTAYDADTDTCLPTEDVCEAGTVFDADSGLCLPDACQSGDVLLNNICVSPAEALAASADVHESENNDFMYGTPDEVALEAPGQQAVITGTIDTPSDLNGDGEVDQDLDSFTFHAQAGQWLEITVQSLGLPAPGFIVEGPNDYSRIVGTGFPHDAARQLALPEDGAYTVTVMPSMLLTIFGQGPLEARFPVGPMGDADWGWVMTIERIATPQPTLIDLSSETMSGTMEVLADNYYEITGAAPGDVVEFFVNHTGRQIIPSFQVWNGSDELIGTIDQRNEAISLRAAVPEQGNLRVLADWQFVIGADRGYEFVGQVLPNATALGEITADSTTTSAPVSIADGARHYFTLRAEAGQVVELSFDNAGELSAWVELQEQIGESVFSHSDFTPLSASTGDTSYAYWYSPSGGTVVATVENRSGQQMDATTLHLNSFAPQSLGQFSDGETVSVDTTDLLAPNRAEFYTFELNGMLNATVDATTPAGESAQLTLFERGVQPVLETTVNESYHQSHLPLETDGWYLVKLTANGQLTSYSFDMALTAPVCGNGYLEQGETCEDGNDAAGDGCSASCTLETGTPFHIDVRSGQTLAVQGELTTSDPVYNRPHDNCSSGTEPTHYETYTLVNDTAETQDLRITAEWTFDGYLHAYANTFDPADPLSTCRVGDDDYNGTDASQLDGYALEPGEQVVIVATGYGTYSTGSYTLTVEDALQ